MATNKMTNKGALQFVLDTYDVPADVAEKLQSMLTQKTEPAL